MSYGLDKYVNNKVSAPVLLFLTVLQLDIKKKENVVPNSFYTPRKLCLWWGVLFSRCPSVRVSVRDTLVFS